MKLQFDKDAFSTLEKSAAVLSGDYNLDYDQILSLFRQLSRTGRLGSPRNVYLHCDDYAKRFKERANFLTYFKKTETGKREYLHNILIHIDSGLIPKFTSDEIGDLINAFILYWKDHFESLIDKGKPEH